jgi:hypothetical protein
VLRAHGFHSAPRQSDDEAVPLANQERYVLLLLKGSTPETESGQVLSFHMAYAHAKETRIDRAGNFKVWKIARKIEVPHDTSLEPLRFLLCRLVLRFSRHHTGGK